MLNRIVLKLLKFDLNLYIIASFDPITVPVLIVLKIEDLSYYLNTRIRYSHLKNETFDICYSQRFRLKLRKPIVIHVHLIQCG